MNRINIKSMVYLKKCLNKNLGIFCYTFLLISLVINSAANRFYSKAIEKFFIIILTQMEGDKYNEFLARITLKIIEAIKDIVGHIIKTVQQDVIILIKNGLSFSGLTIFLVKYRPIGFPHKLEIINTIIIIKLLSFKALIKTEFGMLLKPPGSKLQPVLIALLYTSIP